MAQLLVPKESEKPTHPEEFPGASIFEGYQKHLAEQATKGLYHPEVGAPPIPVEPGATPDD